ncbi:MAG: hypothetical protein QOJ01_2269 [Solirubrobacterales bacterium]|nr:hypothetical protein [Solirubrobacterales bacterium]
MRQRGLGANEPLPDYDDGRLCVRPSDYMATADGAIVPLKLRELGLLAGLSSSAGRVVTREELLERVWECEDGEITPRAVDACVARLRAALSDVLPDLAYIHTHARIGYRFAREAASSEVQTEGAAADPSTGMGSAASASAARGSTAAGSIGAASSGASGSASNL